ncbi:FAD-dependent monooxygenase [Streptomyces sp. NPDC059389]|uniref:NAD(P)/FAD-dependent oxidoreductase n=1 Tax=Streptomyces sp. NPDC059389 TaxID=3346818 RepID=UPI0036D19788
MTHALVLGGGLSGLLSAVALSRHVDRVTVVDYDVYPDGPRPRRGIPQAHQSHMFMGGGADALDQLLPGTTDLLYAAGAHKLRMAKDILTLSADGWYTRFDHDAYLISCTRSLIDYTVRLQALRDDVITVLQGTKVIGLVGNAQKVTGARVQAGTEPEYTISADFVVDATGSRSKAPEWLVELGLPQVEEEHLDAGLAYASRVYEAPEWAREGIPAMLIQAKAHEDGPGGGAGLMPLENGRWIIPLIGHRGGQPPTGEEGFNEFARNVRHPMVARLMATAKPVGEIRGARGLADRRRHWEKLPVPENFIAIGDSATVLSPNYATGMSLAAFGALALRTQLKTYGLKPGLSRRVQADIAKLADGPWMTAISSDRWFPGVKTNIKLKGGNAQRKLVARFAQVATVTPLIAGLAFEVATLKSPASKMMSLSALITVFRGPQRAPLTDAEAIAQFPEFTGRLDEDAPAAELSATTSNLS